MAEDASVKIKIIGETDDVEEKLEAVNDELESIGTDGTETAAAGMSNTSQAASDLAKKGLAAVTTAAAAAAAALGAGATAAAAAGMAYESAFAQVETIMDQSVVSAGDMSAAIMDLSNETGQAATDLSESVYNAISATGDTAGAVGLVADATKLATAGFADASDALSVLSTITNAYGISVDQASAISDSLVQTQNLGVTTVAQLASSMGKAIATASAYSIDLYNLESSYVSLTKAGISTEESTTYLSSLFNELGDSGSDVAAIIQDETGKSFGQLMESGASLGDVMQILVDYCDGDTEALMNLWGSAEAGKAASAIAGQGIEAFNENLDSLRNSAGTTEAAYETMTGTLSYQVNLLKTRVTNFGTAIYDKFSGPLTEAVSTVADAFGDLIESVTDGELSGEIDNIAGSISEFVSAAAGLISDALPGIISGFSWLLDNLGAVTAAVGTLTGAYATYEGVALAAKIATEGFTAALALNPIALAASAAVAGVGLLSIGVIELMDAYENADGSTQQFQASFAGVRDGVAEVETELQALIQEYNQAKAEIAGTTQSNTELIGTLDGLVSSYDGSASALLNINSVIDQLNSAIPDLNLSFDEQSGTLSRSTEELNAINEQYERQQQYTAAQEELTAAQQAQADAIAAEAAAQAEYDAELQEYNEWAATHQTQIAAGDQNALDWAEQLAASEGVLDEAKAKVAAADGAVANAAGSVKYYGDQYDQASEAVDGFSESTEKAATNTEKVSDEQMSLIKSLNEIQDESDGATGSAEELREEYETLKKSYEDLDTTGQEARAELTEQRLEMLNLRATSAELAEGLGYLAGQSGLDFSEISAQLIATGQTAEDFAGTVTSALDDVINGYEKYDSSAWTSLSDAQAAMEYNTAAQQNWVGNLETLWNQAVQSGDSGQMAYVQSLYNMGVESSNIVQGIVDEGGSALADMSASYAESTEAAGEQAALGLSMASGEMYEAGQALTEQAAEGAADGATETETAGSEMDTQIAAGITSNQGVVTSAASTVASAAGSQFSSYSWSSIGVNISAGVAAGVRSGSGLITSAARSAAQAAYNAAKATLQINSPSHLFRDKIGAFIPEGMAAGIRKNTGSATEAVKQSATEIYKTAKLATRPIVQSVSSANNTTNNNNIIKTATGTGQTVTINVPLTVDGREVARASTSQIVSRYDFLYS